MSKVNLKKISIILLLLILTSCKKKTNSFRLELSNENSHRIEIVKDYFKEISKDVEQGKSKIDNNTESIENSNKQDDVFESIRESENIDDYLVERQESDKYEDYVEVSNISSSQDDLVESINTSIRQDDNFADGLIDKDDITATTTIEELDRYFLESKYKSNKISSESNISYIDKIFTNNEDKYVLSKLSSDFNDRKFEKIYSDIKNGNYKNLINCYIILFNYNDKIKDKVSKDFFKQFVADFNKEIKSNQKYDDFIKDVENVFKENENLYLDLIDLLNDGNFGQIFINFNKNNYYEFIDELRDVFKKEKYKSVVSDLEFEFVEGKFSDYTYKFIYDFLEITYKYDEQINTIIEFNNEDVDDIISKLGYDINGIDLYKNKSRIEYVNTDLKTKISLFVKYNIGLLIFIIILIAILITFYELIIFDKIHIPLFDKMKNNKKKE